MLNRTFIIKNFFSLGLFQSVSLVFSLLILPILWKRLGIHVFGEYMATMSIASILAAIVDFNYSARGVLLMNSTEEDVQARKNYINQIYSLQFLLLILVSFIFFFLSHFSGYRVLPSYFIFLGVTLQAIVPSWYLQVRGFFLKYSLLNFCLKVIQVIFIYFIILRSEDYFFLSVIILIMGLMSFMLAHLVSDLNQFVTFKFTNLQDNLIVLMRDCHFFLNSFLPGVLLNFVVYASFIKYGSESAGVLGLAEKLLRVPLLVRNVFIYTILPGLNVGVNDLSFVKIREFVQRAMIVSFVASVALTCFIVIFSQRLLCVLGFEYIDMSELNLSILFLKFIIGSLSMIMVYWYFMPKGYNSFISNLSLLVNGSFLFLFFIFFFLPINLSFYLSLIPLAEAVIFVFLIHKFTNDKK